MLPEMPEANSIDQALEQAANLGRINQDSCDVTPRIRRPRARDGVRPAGIKQRERSCRRWQL
jgi:hypothetical protein